MDPPPARGGAGPFPPGNQPSPLGPVAGNASDARGLDQPLERLHAPVRETPVLSPGQESAKFKPAASGARRLRRRPHSLFALTFVHGLNAPIACCCTLRFQILFPQKA